MSNKTYEINGGYMPGTKLGGQRAAATNKAKYGESFYERIGSVGGRATGVKGFAAMTPEKRREAGRKGGAISKRGKSIKMSTADKVKIYEDFQEGFNRPTLSTRIVSKFRRA